MTEGNSWIALDYDPKTKSFGYSGMTGNNFVFNSSAGSAYREEYLASEVFDALKRCFPNKSAEQYKRMIKNKPAPECGVPLTRAQLTKFNKRLDDLLEGRTGDSN